MHQVVSKLGVPVEALASIGNDIYRKPCPGLWQLIKDK